MSENNQTLVQNHQNYQKIINYNERRKKGKNCSEAIIKHEKDANKQKTHMKSRLDK